MKNNIPALVILAFIATPALAGDGKRYVGIDFGTASFGNLSPSPRSNAFRFVSGYHFTPMLAVEFDYSQFGEITVTNDVGSSRISAGSFQVASVGTIPVNQDFDLIGKIGLATNRASGSTTIPGRTSISMMHNDVYIGLGAQYHINSQVSLSAQYDNYGKFEKAASSMKASSVTFGVIYNY